MGHQRKDEPSKASEVPLASPEPGDNPGYAEDRPKTPAQARMPGARPAPDGEEGGLEHDPDPDT